MPPGRGRAKCHVVMESPVPASAAVSVDLPRQGLQGRHGGGRRRYLFARVRLGDRASGRQRRRQDHHDRDDHGAGRADLRLGFGARRRDAAPAPPGPAAHELRKPLCGNAHAADGAPEPHRVRPPLRRRRRRLPHRRTRRRTRPRRSARPAERQALRRPEDPRVARQGAPERSRTVASRRTDGLARPRHGRLGAQPAGALPRRTRRHHPARLPQHE